MHPARTPFPTGLLFALLAPLAAAAVWLVYSSAQVGRWQLLGREMRQTQADREKLEAEMESRAAAAEATRKELEQKLQASGSESRDANARIAELEDTLRRIRNRHHGVSLTGLTGAKWHASLQPKSGNTEAAIVENRDLLGKGFAEMEKHLGQALPKEKRAPRLWIYYRDDEQNALVASIKSLMEGEGAVVVSTMKQKFGRQKPTRWSVSGPKTALKRRFLPRSCDPLEASVKPLSEWTIPCPVWDPGDDSRSGCCATDLLFAGLLSAILARPLSGCYFLARAVPVVQWIERGSPKA